MDYVPLCGLRATRPQENLGVSWQPDRVVSPTQRRCERIRQLSAPNVWQSPVSVEKNEVQRKAPSCVQAYAVWPDCTQTEHTEVTLDYIVS